MFQKTHIRLTFINSIVFIVLISIMGSIIYFYTQNQLYRDVNRSLLDTISHFQTQNSSQDSALDDGQNLGDSNLPPLRRDPRLIILVWNKKHQLLEQSRGSELFVGNEKLVEPKNFNKLTDINIADYSYRYMAVQVDTNIGKVSIQVIRNTNSERELLDRLLLIMIIGCGIGILCAVGSGYFLAGRALIPIKNAWQKQQQFVSDASHELRTPLAVIQAKTELLFRSPSSSIKEKIIDISTISNESRRLSKLVTNLLTLARSDSDQIEVKKESFRVDQLLMEIMQQYEEIVAYQEKSLVLNAADPVSFLGDRERIHQLIVILLDNAIKFTSEGGEIRLSCSQSHSSIILQVEDSGIGITEKDIPKIFDRFYQGDKSRTGAEGTGLGLSIAKWIIDKHHGKVKVTSSLGKGTLFEITFPKNK
ncbi:MAG: HAMP domain-containing sensor histidine kinase [Bacillota bacterium]|nr:HAMP domain-containing sensor histidine kinase [Bacillota bacterium]